MGAVVSYLQRYCQAMLAAVLPRHASRYTAPLSLPARAALCTAAASTQPPAAPRRVASTSTLQRLDRVPNCRDLAEACPAIRPNRVFRSACPYTATQQDIAVVRHDLNIHDLVDLRSDEERAQDGEPALLQHARLLRSVREGRLCTLETFEEGASSDAHAAVLSVHHISLLQRQRYYKGLVKRLPALSAAKIVLTYMLDRDRAKTLAIREVNRAGLPGLYEVILTTSAAELGCALEVILSACAAERPVLFFCKIGKDRTGLLAALLLSCCGASHDEIIADYVRSDSVHAVALGGIEKEEARGLDVELFTRAPAEAMAATLDFLTREYGGASQYMAAAGFSLDKQQQLRQALTS